MPLYLINTSKPMLRIPVLKRADSQVLLFVYPKYGEMPSWWFASKILLHPCRLGNTIGGGHLGRHWLSSQILTFNPLGLQIGETTLEPFKHHLAMGWFTLLTCQSPEDLHMNSTKANKILSDA